MPRISSAGPSNADVVRETAVLTKQGKLDQNSKPVEWASWKAN